MVKMKLLKKSMLALSVMTLIGGMAFAAAPKNRKKAPARKTVAKKAVAKDLQQNHTLVELKE